MHYTNPPNGHSSPQRNTSSQNEVHSDQFRLFDALRAMDDVQFKTALDDFYASVPAYWTADAGPPVSEPSDYPGLSLSVEAMATGELTVPDTTPHESFDNMFNLYSQNLDSSTSNLDPYSVSQDYSISPIPYHDSFHTGEFDASSYSTHWEKDVHLHSNSRKLLQSYHTETGMSNHEIPVTNVMQQSQKLDIPSTSEYTQTDFSPETFGYHHYTPFPGDIQQNVSGMSSSHLIPLTTVPSYPTLYPNQPVLHCPPSAAEGPVPSLSPSTSLADTPSSYIPATPHCPPYPSSSSSAAPVYPTTTQYQTPTKKRARISKKIASSPVTTPQKARGTRKYPGGRAPIRSQLWLDRFFPDKGACTLCGRGPSRYRPDRALEHLVSTHIFQVVKNHVHFEIERLSDAMSFVHTEEQFKLVRQYIDRLKCSLCPKETSLVVREDNIKKHLDMVHGDLQPEARQEELERVKGLTGERQQWYSFHDEFLFKFSSLQQPSYKYVGQEDSPPLF